MAKAKTSTSKVPAGPNALGALVSAEVTREETRRTDFRSRSVTLLGISSGIVTITTGLVANAAISPGLKFSFTSAVLSVAALVALVASACFTLLVNTSTHDYIVEDVTDLAVDVNCKWDDPGWDQEIARLQVDYLSRLRNSNEKKKWLLNMSVFSQILGVAIIAATAVIVVTSS